VTEQKLKHHLRTTQQDIAERVGVSRATVSAVLSGTRFVNPELKARILETIEDLHYVPDIVARSLKTNRTMTIGLVLPNILSPIWATIARGAADVARSAGYSTIMYDTDERCEVMQAALRNLREKRVDGIILAPCGDCLDLLSAFLSQVSIPVVLIDRFLEGLPLDSVVSDDENGAYQATRHFIEMGRRRIGLINLPGNITTGHNRLQGYRRALSESGLPVDESILAVGGRGQQEGYRRTLDLLSLPPDCQPEALLVSSHLMTIGAITAIRQKGKHIPAEISVIGFDDTPWAPLLDPPLTVVHQPAYEMGAKSAELLQTRLYPEPHLDGPQHIVLPTTLVHRGSCCSRGSYP
jgi:LacI family transcriptional regulator